jgi:hypothetical protein
VSEINLLVSHPFLLQALAALLPLDDELGSLLDVSGHQVEAVGNLQVARIRKHLKKLVQLRLELIAL